MTDPHAPEIRRVLTPFARGDDMTRDWLLHSVGRILHRAARRGAPWQGLVDDAAIAHIADWFVAARKNDLAWTRKTDDRGIPRKLGKFSSIEAMTAEADRAMIVMAQSGHAVSLVDGDEELYADLGNGNRLIRLMTPAALDREGAAMGHCIGNGAYDERLSGDDLFLSLRDARGRAHVTLEVENGILTQLQGKGNEIPAEKWVEVVTPFLKKFAWEINIPVNRIGHVIDRNGDWHRLDALPEGLSVSGNLDLRDTEITALPDGLSVGGSLELSHTGITSLPEGLSVGGYLDLSHSEITSLPERLSVGGSLYLNHSEITSLSEGVFVGGSLDLSYTGITFLPEGLSVGRSLILNRTGITSLPKGLSVGSFFDLNQTGITSLPEGMSVGESLDLSRTGITSLPEGLSVGGSLDLSNTGITSLPEGLFVGLALDLRGTDITVIPESVTVTMSVVSPDGSPISLDDFRAEIRDRAEDMSP